MKENESESRGSGRDISLSSTSDPYKGERKTKWIGRMSLRFQPSSKEVHKAHRKSLAKVTSVSLLCSRILWGAAHGMIGSGANAVMDLRLWQLGPSVTYTPEVRNLIDAYSWLAHYQPVYTSTQIRTFSHTNSYKTITFVKVKI